MRTRLFPFALALALGAFATSAWADDVGDSVGDDVGDDFTAVPEPGAALAMGAGLATIAFALRRRRS
ncbi:MAG TPA: PEP-CTERM sorting domain-containing protein [Myxococcota bacterium]|jgi:hypothetical protein|nr:PEP-CTERM sorting domain-containing protein [Myxococcota bacterium]